MAIDSGSEFDISHFFSCVEGGGSLLSLDLGSRVIGLAVSDTHWRVSSPIPPIIRTKFALDIQALTSVISERDIVGIVLGWPLNMDGSLSRECDVVRSFRFELGFFVSVPFLFWDERLTSIAADRSLLEGNLSRVKRSARIDSIASSLILRGVLERLRSLSCS